MDIFRTRADYLFLISRLKEYLQPGTMGTIASSRRKTFPTGSFSLLSYCLMPNHYHFLIRQNQDISLATLMLNLWTGYSKYFNKKYGHVGSIFQDQFKAVHVDNDSYLKWLSAYIHQNPTVAGMVQKPSEYPHSSYNEYLSTQNLCETQIILEQFIDQLEYETFVSESLNTIKENKEINSLLID